MRFFRTFKVRCPDGTVKIVHRSIDDAFPLYLKEWKGNASAEIPGLPEAPNVSAEYASQIGGLLFGVDEFNNSLAMEFRMAYVAYMNDPCTNSEFFNRQVTQITARLHRLTNARLQIRALVALAAVPTVDRKAFNEAVQEVVANLGPSVAAIGAKAAIDETMDVAKKWTQSESND